MGLLLMSDKERLIKALMEMVVQKKLKLGKVAKQLEISYRQAKRIYRRYKENGDAGLIHKRRGQTSNRIHPHKEAIITRYMEKYEGFGPTLAAEYLFDEDGYDINHETLRRWLLSAGLWQRQRKRSPYRSRRECRAQFGELLQIDGSIHDWLEVGYNVCLLNIVDDATTTTLSRLDTGETTRVIFLALWQWIEKYGIPLAIYVDRKNVYVSPKDKSFSHVQVACKKLGIRIIKAHSPQAKGRVERNHSVYQDRLVKELRLRGIKTVDAANGVLDNGFTDKLNAKFAKIARNPESAHRPLNDIDLNQILCWEYERQVQNDWVFSFRAKYYQIAKAYGSCVKPKVKIAVREHLDGTISAWYNEEKLAIKIVPNRIKLADQITNIVPRKIQPNLQIPKAISWKQSNAMIFKDDDNQIPVKAKLKNSRF